LKRHIPNAVTCLNLLCGCLALTFILTDKDGYSGLTAGAFFVGVGAVADFFDGLAARALRVSSPIGKDLDSLADMVSFGVVPGAILFNLLSQFGGWGVFSFSGFIVTIFSALRLAKFNNDTRQTTSFIGLPTPACTLVVASLPLILENASKTGNNFLLTWLTNPWLLLGLAILLSGLLVAELPLFALKFKNLKWVGNRRRFIFVALALVLVLTLRAAGIPLAVLLYVLLSVPGRVRSREGLEASPGAPQ
jgi:CDP-diacylglycerol--serine O-phosphatidyltransferase